MNMQFIWHVGDELRAKIDNNMNTNKHLTYH